MIGVVALWNRLRAPVRHKGRRRLRSPGLRFERYGLDALEKRQMLAVAPASDFTYAIDNGQVTITRYVGSSPTVEIPATIDGQSVTSIGGEAFADRTTLTSVTIPATVTTIGVVPFIRCTGLTSITVSADNSAYSSQDGVLFTKDWTTLLACPAGKSGSVAIPAGVSHIAVGAFQGCALVTAVSIPSSVKTIGYMAFNGCHGLTTITIPSGVTEIGDGAFSACSLTTVNVPASVTTIGSNPFASCLTLTAITVAADNAGYTSLDGVLFTKDGTLLISYPSGRVGSYAIPIGVAAIGHASFRDCAGLASITIPEGVTYIGETAFWNCTGLTSISIPDTVTSTSTSVFGLCENLRSVRLSRSLAHLEAGLFMVCPKLADVTIPDSVTYIGSGVFDGCASLTSILIPANVTSMGDEVFRDCLALTTVKMKASPPAIGTSIFEGVDSSKAIVYYPAGASGWTETFGGLTTRPYAEPGAPSAVSGLAGISQVTLSWTAPSDDGGLSIRDYTIQYSSNGGSSWQTFSRGASTATSATVTGLINGTGYSFRVASVNDLGASAYSPDSAVVTPVSDFAYTKTNGQVTITGYAGSSAAIEIPSTIDGLPVTAIGDNAFWGLSWITSISIPSGVESIGFGSFAATGITTLDLPASLKSFSNSVYACRNLASIYVEPANSVYVSIDGILYDKSLQTVLRCPQARTLPVTLPDTVSAVAANAFAGCTQVTVVNGLQPTASIGWDAFAGCDNLRHVLALSDTTVPGDYLTYTIWTSGVIVTGYFGTGTSVVVPDTILGRPIFGIGSDAFNTRGALESIVIPRSVTGIGNAAFANCTNLKSIVIPDQVAYIGFNAFQYCTSLTSISLPASVTHIGAVCFFGCSNLVSIEVEGGNATFASAGGLLYDKTLSTLIDCPEGKSGTVVLPASVTAIGREGLDMTFAECKQLTRIVIPGGVTAIVGRAFENCPAIVETTGASPFAPGNLAGVRGNGQVQLSWTAPVSTGGMSVTDYTVQYSVDGSSWQTFSRTASTATTATVTGLFNGTGYLFRVASVNDVRTGVYSATSAMVTPSTVPDAPAAVTGVRGSGQIQLSWAAPASHGGLAVKDYTVQYSTDGSSWQTFARSASTATSAMVTGLRNGTGYFFRIASVNDVGTGAFSSAASKIVPSAVPLPPTNVSATRGRGVVIVSWTAPVSTAGVRITDYRVQQSINGGVSWVTVGDGVSISTRTVVSGLVMGRDYIFRVAAISRSGAGDFSLPSGVVTPATVPSAPVGVLATGGMGQVAISWKSPTSNGGSPINGYIVQYSPSAGRWVTSTTVGSNTTTATVGGLLANRSYSFRVLAVNEMGNSPASRVVATRTLRPSLVRV